MMKVGLVGMPNAGKSSLFNALSQAGAEAANYPFTTIEPNVAVVPVKDERMEQVAATVKASTTRLPGSIGWFLLGVRPALRQPGQNPSPGPADLRVPHRRHPLT